MHNSCAEPPNYHNCTVFCLLAEISLGLNRAIDNLEYVLCEDMFEVHHASLGDDCDNVLLHSSGSQFCSVHLLCT